MTILVIGAFCPGSLDSSYVRAFERNGHEVFRFQSDRAYFQASWFAGNRLARRLFRSLLWRRLNLSTIEIARCVRPALIVAFKTPYLDPETIRRIRVREGIPIVNYYPDNPYCGIPWDPRKTSAQRRNIIEALREYARVFTWEKGLVNRLTADKVSASYLPFGSDPECYRPYEKRPCRECGRRHPVVFIGQYNAKRERHVDAIKRHEVALWHPSWRRAEHRFKGRHVIHRESAFGADCAAIYSSAEVSLNIVDDLNMPGHNMRTFEIPASSGVMLSSYTAEQAEFFPEGEAAWYYRDPVELDGLLERLLSDKEAQARTRTAALRMAQDHSYDKRAQELVAALLGKGT